MFVCLGFVESSVYLSRVYHNIVNLSGLFRINIKILCRDSYTRVMSPDSVAVLPLSGDGSMTASYLHLIPPDGTPPLSTFSDRNEATKSPPVKGIGNIILNFMISLWPM